MQRLSSPLLLMFAWPMLRLPECLVTFRSVLHKQPNIPTVGAAQLCIVQRKATKLVRQLERLKLELVTNSFYLEYLVVLDL